MPNPRGLPMSTSTFVDSDLAGDKKNRCNQIGVLIFLNKAPVHRHSKHQQILESSNFSAELRAIKKSLID